MAAVASLVWLPRTFWYRERSLSRMSEPELRSWTERRPDDPLGHSFLGLARGRSGDTAEAARQWTRALELDPTLAGVRWRLARLLAAAGQEREAERLLRQGLQLDPAAVRLHAELGRLYEESASFRSAAAAWEKAASLAPHDAETWHHLGRCWMRLNEEARAVRAYRRAAELDPRSATYQKALSGALRLERQYAEAERHCRRAIALDAADPEAQFALAKLLWDRDGATAQTAAQMRRALALQPDNPILHYSMAAVYRERRRLAESAREYQATLRLLEAREPPPTEAGWAAREEWLSQMAGPHLNLAGVLERLGRSTEAARHRAVFRRISDYRNHVHQLQVRIDNRPDDAGLRFELARAHARAGSPFMRGLGSTRRGRSSGWTSISRAIPAAPSTTTPAAGAWKTWGWPPAPPTAATARCKAEWEPTSATMTMTGDRTMQLFLNQRQRASADDRSSPASGRFRDASEEAGEPFQRRVVGRGAAFGDFNNDGRLDVAAIDMEGAALLLRNDGPADAARRGHWLIVRALTAPAGRGAASRPGGPAPRDAIGAQITVTAGGLRQLREIQTSGSVLSAHDPRAHFGLGTATRVDRLAIRWPDGATETLSGLPVDRILTIRQGETP